MATNARLIPVPPFRLYLTVGTLTWETKHASKDLNGLIKVAHSINGWDEAKIYDVEGQVIWEEHGQ